MAGLPGAGPHCAGALRCWATWPGAAGGRSQWPMVKGGALALEARLPQPRAPKPRRRPRGRPTAGGGHARPAKELHITVPVH